MHKVFVAKKFDYLTGFYLFMVVLFVALDGWLVATGMRGNALLNIILLEAALVVLVGIMLIFRLSRKIFIDEKGITQRCFHVPGLTPGSRHLAWEDVSEVWITKGFFHIGDTITLRIPNEKTTFKAHLRETNQITISNSMELFPEIVREIVRRTPHAILDEGINRL